MYRRLGPKGLEKLIQELKEYRRNKLYNWTKFRKKPVVVEAYQTETEELIETLEGLTKASPGDWIIRGIKGEVYPCKPDIFSQTYDPI